MDLSKTNNLDNPWASVSLDDIKDGPLKHVLEKIVRTSKQEHERFFELAQTTLSITNKLQGSVGRIESALLGDKDMHQEGALDRIQIVQEDIKELKEWKNSISADRLDALEEEVRDLRFWKKEQKAVRDNTDRTLDRFHKLWPFLYILGALVLAYIAARLGGGNP